jgi:hypothetical protein
MNFLSSFSKAEMVHPYGSLILLVSILLLTLFLTKRRKIYIVIVKQKAVVGAHHRGSTRGPHLQQKPENPN